MPLKGSLDEAGLSEIFQLLALGKKSGCLGVTNQRDFGHVFFREGRVVFASLVNGRARLGERLLSEGRIDAAELAAAVAAHERQPERRLGALLVERGALTAEELARALAIRVEETVYALFDWRCGTFHFEAGQEPPPGELLVSLEVAALLLEGARRADEWARIRRRLPHGRLILEKTAAVPPEGAAPGAAVLWNLVDGARDVAGVLGAAPMDEFRALKGLHDLLAAGRVRVRSESPATGEPPPERQCDECRKLGVAFYRAGMHAEAAREFRRVLALDARDAEAHFHLGLVAFREERLEEARVAFARAADLTPQRATPRLNLALALEALGHLDEAARMVDSVLRWFPDHGPARLHRAVLCYRAGDYAVGLRLLEGLDLDERLQPVAAFYRAMLHALHWDLRSARELLSAIAGGREDARALNNLGAVFERGERLEEARASYQAALEARGAESSVRKNLGDLCSREGKREQARAWYLQAVQDDPSNAGALSRLGSLAFEEGRGPEAVAYWESALASDPLHDSARRSLALVPSARAS